MGSVGTGQEEGSWKKVGGGNNGGWVMGEEAREEGKRVEGGGIQDLGVGNSGSPISSSHYLNSMNGFWHQRQEKQRSPPPPPIPLPPTFPNPPPAPQFHGGPSRSEDGEQKGEVAALGASRGRGEMGAGR